MPFYIHISNEEKAQYDNNAENYKLEISPLFKRKFPFFGKEKYPIQRKVYFNGIKVKNISSKVTPEGRVSSFGIEREDKSMHMIDNELEIMMPSLNPSDSIELWWPDPISISFSGGARVICKITSINGSKFFMYQRCEYAKTTGDLCSSNIWYGPVHIRSVFEHQQERTNMLIVVLTVITIAIGCIAEFEKLKSFISNIL